MTEPDIDLLIITEASEQIGYGHVMRCCALEEEARRRGLKVFFLAKSGYLQNILTSMSKRFVVSVLPTKIVPYIIRDLKDGSDMEEVKAEVERGSRVLLMDELGTARVYATHVVDALMTNFRQEAVSHNLHTCYLYGLNYLPISNELAKYRLSGLFPSDEPRLLVTFGGADLLHVTLELLKELDLQGFKGPATVILGKSSEDYPAVEAIVKSWKESVLLSFTNNMPLEMSRATIVVTKLGMTEMEALCMGRVCITIQPGNAHNVLESQLRRSYANWPVQDFGIVSSNSIVKAASRIVALLNNQNKCFALGEQGISLIDGCGVERIIDTLTTTQTMSQ